MESFHSQMSRCLQLEVDQLVFRKKCGRHLCNRKSINLPSSFLQQTISSKSTNFINVLSNSSALVPSLLSFTVNYITMATNSTFVLYHYTPNLPCAILLAVLFGLTTSLHLYQRIKAHSKYFNPFIVGGICLSRQSKHKLLGKVAVADVS